MVTGLVSGKFLGIGLGVPIARRLGLGALPQGVGTGQALGSAALSDIRFTVSLLIVHLSFDTPALREEAASACRGPRRSRR